MSSANQPNVGSRYGTTSGFGDSARHVAEGAQSYLSHGYERVEDTVANHPGASALVVFGLGVGVGILIGAAIASSRQKTALESMQANWLNRRQAEKLGRRVLASITEHLPASLAHRVS